MAMAEQARCRPRLGNGMIVVNTAALADSAPAAALSSGIAESYPDFDTSVPNMTRMYDYLLGGKDNYEADREAAREVVAAMPNILPTAQANRAFLRRAVQYLVEEAGIRQFLDIGTGLPTAQNTHEVAQQIAPESRIVYVDNDRFKSGCARVRWPSQDA